MRSFKDTRIISAEVAVETVFSYQAKHIGHTMTEQAEDFIKTENESVSRGFIMDEILAKRSMVSEEQNKKIEEEVESRVLEQMKSVQEDAYKGAYELGLKDGTSKAYMETMAELKQNMVTFNKLISQVTMQKSVLMSQNEAHLVQLVFYIASRIAQTEISEKPDSIVPILKKLVDEAQSMESINIKLSPQDFAFIEKVKVQTPLDFTFLEKAKLVETPSLEPGGCIIESNYGVIDATLPERVNKVWETLKAKLPKVEDVA